MKDRTIVLVAYRLASIKLIDRIALIDDGRIAEIGSHDELVAAGGRYAALYRSWQQSASAA